MLKLAAGPAGVLQIGKVYDLAQDVGNAFVAGEAAECVDEVAKEAAPPVETGVETQTRTPPENALGRGPKKGGKPKPSVTRIDGKPLEAGADGLIHGDPSLHVGPPLEAADPGAPNVGAVAETSTIAPKPEA